MTPEIEQRIRQILMAVPNVTDVRVKTFINVTTVIKDFARDERCWVYDEEITVMNEFPDLRFDFHVIDQSPPVLGGDEIPDTPLGGIAML